MRLSATLVFLLSCTMFSSTFIGATSGQTPIPPAEAGRGATAAPTNKPESAGSPARLWTRVRVPDPHVAFMVRRVLDELWRLLGEPRCQSLLDEFRDVHGRPLRDRLAIIGLDVQRYLEFVLFEDGSQYSRCENTVAYTVPGSRVVYLCAAVFEREWRQHRRQIVAKTIHEVLHTLGLGEDPPSSAEITERVLARCGDS